MDGHMFDALIEELFKIGVVVGIAIILAAGGLWWLGSYLYHHLQWIP